MPAGRAGPAQGLGRGALHFPRPVGTDGGVEGRQAAGQGGGDAVLGRVGDAGWQRQGYLATAPAGPDELGAPNRGPVGHGFSGVIAVVAPQVKALAWPCLETKSLGDEGGRFKSGGADHRQVGFDAQ